MIIESIESLRTWLTDRLRPICDADPSALAKYVVALIKKEKPLDELRDVCIDQLDVFLADETKKFVAELFDALETKSYLQSNQLMIQPNVPALNAVQVPKSTSADLETEDTITKSTEENLEESKKEEEEKHNEDDQVDKKEKENIPEDGSKKKLIEGKPNDHEREHIRSDRQWRKEKDLANSVEEFLNAKKPRNDSERGGTRGRTGRSTSPGSRRSPRRQSPRRYRSRRERRRRSEERRGSRKRTRCRDYDEKGFCLLGNSCPFDHGRDPVVVDDVNIPNMFGIQGLQPNLPSQPTQQLAPAPDMFTSLFQLPTSTVIANPVASIQSTGLSLDTGLTLVGGQQQRPLPSVAELPQNLPLLVQPQPALTTIMPLAEEGKTDVGKEQTEKASTETSKSEGGSEAYNPEEPSIGLTDPVKKSSSWSSVSQKNTSTKNHVKNNITRPNVYPPTTITAEQFLQRMYTPSSFMQTQLAAVSLPDSVKSILQGQTMTLPAVPSPALPMVSPMVMTSLASAPRLPVSNPPRRPFMNQTILEIRKVPKESNTVVKLSEYFQKFGSIVNIQVNYENDLQAALIQFASNAEARRAYSSPEAVLGNRFIKLFWHNKTKELPPLTSNLPIPNEQKLVRTPPSDTESGVSNPTEASVVRPKLPSTGQTTYVNPQNTPEALQKKQAEMKKEALKKKLEIQRQRRMLLEKQIKEQKALITKLEKNKSMSANEKQLLMNALKDLTGSIEKLKTDLETQAKANKPMSKQAIQKELLDRDIELYSKQFTGEDLTGTRNAMSELRKEANNQITAKSRPAGRGRSRGRGRGMMAGRGRGYNPNAGFEAGTRTVVDNRPKQVLVTGYEEKDKEAVVAQFASYGEIDKVDVKPGGKLVLSFHTRKQAEIAATKAAVFNGKRLVLAWYTAAQPTKRSSSSGLDATPAKVQRRETRKSSVSSLLSDDNKEDDLLDDLDDKEADLLLLEEDEEEEDEERSWKR